MICRTTGTRNMYANVDSARAVRVGVYFLYQSPHSVAGFKVLQQAQERSMDFFRGVDVAAALLFGGDH